MNRMEEAVGEVNALARGLQLLRVVGAASNPLSHREIAHATGIPKATVTRLVGTLVSCGFLQQGPIHEGYSLGPALLDLSHRYLHRFDLRSIVRPHLVELAEFAGASVHMGVRDDLDILVIDTIRPRSALITSRIEVGSRITIATSAAGRAWLASHEPDARQPVLDRIRQESGEYWATLQPRLLAAMDEYERVGYCTSFGEWHPHIHALGFALRGPQGERYALSCGGPGYLLPRKTLLTSVAPKLLETIARIREETGA